MSGKRWSKRYWRLECQVIEDGVQCGIVSAMVASRRELKVMGREAGWAVVDGQVVCPYHAIPCRADEVTRLCVGHRWYEVGLGLVRPAG